MKKNLVLALLLSTVWLPIAASAQSFSDIFVFGDSLSDTGNLAAALAPNPLPLPPAHSNGGRRFSNGPLAVEVLAGIFDLHVDPFLMGTGGTNFAFASARAAGGDEDIGLSTQMAAFFAAQTNAGGEIPADALYIIIIGGNDVRAAALAGDEHSAKKIIKRAVRKIEKSVQRLVAAGAKTIIVGNSSDVSLLPEAAFLVGAGDVAYPERASRLSMQFNKRLSKRLNLRRHRHGHRGKHGKDHHDFDKNDAKIVLFDIFSFFKFIISNHEPLGFSNTEAPCFINNQLAFNPLCFAGDSPLPIFERFIFFDLFHPTANVHKMVGQGLFSAIPLLGGASH